VGFGGGGAVAGSHETSLRPAPVAYPYIGDFVKTSSLMDVAARLTSKGQVTIPKSARDALHLTEGDSSSGTLIQSFSRTAGKTALAYQVQVVLWRQSSALNLRQ
jgi:hypothetical protein